MTSSSRFIICLLLTASMFAMAFAIIPSPASANWIPDATLATAPGTLYPEETYTFDYTLTIGAISGSASVEIYHFQVQLDWEASSVELVTSTVVIVLPGSHTFHRTITIPQATALGSHDEDFAVQGKAASDLFSSWGNWAGSVSVAARDTLSLSISGNPSAGAFPLDVAFTSTANGGTNTQYVSGSGWSSLPYSYSWTFGDGGTSTSANPTHQYASAGSFTATLTITDGLSRTKSATFGVTVTVPSVTLTISATPTYGTYNLEVDFTSTVSGGVPTYSYSWDFGDGGTSAQADPTHTYKSAGTFTVTLVVHDGQSGTATKTLDITVTAPTGGTGSASGDMTLIILILVVVVAAVIGTAIYLATRKKNQMPPNNP